MIKRAPALSGRRDADARRRRIHSNHIINGNLMPACRTSVKPDQRQVSQPDRTAHAHDTCAGDSAPSPMNEPHLRPRPAGRRSRARIENHAAAFPPRYPMPACHTRIPMQLVHAHRPPAIHTCGAYTGGHCPPVRPAIRGVSAGPSAGPHSLEEDLAEVLLQHALELLEVIADLSDPAARQQRVWACGRT